MTTVSWTPTTSGTWATPTAWVNNNGVVGVPLRGDDVDITVASSITVTYTSGTVVLNTITTGATDAFDMTAGTLATLEGALFNGALMMTAGELLLGGGAGFGGTVTMSGGEIDLRDGGNAVNGVFNMSGGTLHIDHGTFVDSEFGSLLGTISGARIEFNDSNQGGSTVLQSGLVLNTNSVTVTNTALYLGAGESLTYGGIFTLGQGGVFNLNGNSANLSGISSLDGYVRGGTLSLSGSGHFFGMILDNGADVSISGGHTYDQTGGIALGDANGTGTLSVASSATLRLVDNSFISEGSSSGTLINAGLIVKTAGSALAGTSVISSDVINTGTIEANFGAIDFAGPNGGVATIGGTLAGTGTIEFTNGSYFLQGETFTAARTYFGGSSTSVTLATSLTYGGNWNQFGGLILVENQLVLDPYSGSATPTDTAFDYGEMKGTAVIAIDSTQLHLGNGMDLEGNLTFDLNTASVNGVATPGTPSPSQIVTQTGGINLGELSDAVDLVNVGTASSWYLEGATGITGAYGTINNAGLFDKVSGPGDSIVTSTFNNTGTLAVQAGTLSLSGQGTLGGSVIGNAVLDLSGAFVLSSGISLTVASLILDQSAAQNDVQATLSANLTYAGAFSMEGGTLALSNAAQTSANTLTLNGITSLGTGTILGLGDVNVRGAATIGATGALTLVQGADIQFQGATQLLSNIVMTSSVPISLNIGTASVFTMDTGTSIGGPSNSVVGTVVVGGTLQMEGQNAIAAAIVDNGKINISNGEMQFLGPLTGSGALTISAGGVLDLYAMANTTTGVAFGTGGGELYLANPSYYAGVIANFGTGDIIELGGIQYGTATSLSVSGDMVTVTGTGGTDILNFSSAQSTLSLTLGAGSHGGLALIHT